MAKRDLDKPEIKPVVIGNVSKKKKGLLGGFIEEDGKTIMSEIRDEILIPTFKDIIFNSIKTGIEMLLWGESTGNYTRSGRNSGGRNYNQMYSNRNSGRSNVRRGNPHNRYEVEVIEFDNRADADAVLDVLADQIENYGVFSMADYYKAAGTDYEYTDENYGWYDMRGISIHRVGSCWTIDFPKASPLD